MKQVYDLSKLQWTVEGYTPFIWTFEKLFGLGDPPRSVDVPPIPAQVPGSVQNALRRANLLPDWNLDFNSRQCEWVENRHWLYRANLP
ncbi:MAG: glycosyl hydrolase 2 galactose-binding domain-containing protein, partial [Omnitrophica WOR_2 bacterium]